jgi:PKD repeat protein
MGEIVMKYNISLKCSIHEVLDFLNSQIQELSNTHNTKDISNILKDIASKVSKNIDSEELNSEIKSLSKYISNPFSELKNEESINGAKQRVLSYLNEINTYLSEDQVKFIDYKSDIDEYTSILILKKILNNFYEHMKVMYLDNVHGKGNITKAQLDNIRIGNEYDVQRILFSLIKPIFPDARTEVTADTGCSTVRYDIDIESCNTTIEVKCSRLTMSERTLNEEMGSDSFHYQRKNIIFFVYDKESIISNISAYKKMYNKAFDGKSIDIIIIQPIKL